MNDRLGDLRKEYTLAGLHEADVDPDPIVEVTRWLEAAVEAGLPEPNAMTLATASADGVPSARIVLLKSIDADGLRFFTNYESRKGRELAENGRAALLFFWPELERQVRVEGTVERVAAAESDAYFRTRPRMSQLGAWASAQSTPLADRASLEARVAALESQYANTPVPRPPHWGGYLLRPLAVELWQGRPSRLHDRLRYERRNHTWHLTRLSP